MALLKAFVCQMVLFGLYKLFLEEIVEAHLVPDELTRNCLVGFVCLVCFGIQLYTDKADDDIAEVDENPKAKSESSGAKSMKKSEPPEISATRETVGSNVSSRATTHGGIFAEYSPNVMKMNGTGVSDVPVVSTVKSSYNQETTTTSVLTGFSESKVCEESDDEGIEIDQFVSKQSDEVEQSKIVEAKGAEPIKGEDATVEAKNLRADEAEVINPQASTEEAKQSAAIEPEVEPIKAEVATEETKNSRADEVEVTNPQDTTEEARQSAAVEPEEAEPIKSEDMTEEAEQLISIEAEDVEVIKSEEVIVEVDQSRTNEVEANKPDKVTAIVESKCLNANGDVEVKSTAFEPEEIELISEDATREAGQLRTIKAEDVEMIKSEDVIEKVNQSKTEVEVVKPEEVTESDVVSQCFIANEKEVEVIKPESAPEDDRQSKAIEDEVEATKFEEVVEVIVDSESLIATGDEVEVIKPESATGEVKQTRAIEDEIEATKSEKVAEAVVDSECLLVNGEDLTSTQDSGKSTNLVIFESEAQMANGIAKKSLNNTISISSNIIEEIKSREFVEDEGEIGNAQETTLPSQPDEYKKDIQESLPSPQTSNTTSIPTTVVNDLETVNKNNAETTLGHTTVSSPSEKLTVSTSRQKTTVTADVCVAPITIDISFIYACH